MRVLDASAGCERRGCGAAIDHGQTPIQRLLRWLPGWRVRHLVLRNLVGRNEAWVRVSIQDDVQQCVEGYSDAVQCCPRQTLNL
jgi:hypothetical protein